MSLFYRKFTQEDEENEHIECEPVAWTSEASLQTLESGREAIAGCKNNLRIHALYTIPPDTQAKITELEAENKTLLNRIEEISADWLVGAEKLRVAEDALERISSAILITHNGQVGALWQACAEQYKATINTLNDAITEDKILAGINADLEERLKVAEDALKFYADVEHIQMPESHNYKKFKDEHTNWFEHEHYQSSSFIENGEVASEALNKIRGE